MFLILSGQGIIFFFSNVSKMKRIGLVFERYWVRTAVRIRTKLTGFFIIFPSLYWQMTKLRHVFQRHFQFIIIQALDEVLIK
jgi:hypothetical protein